jgi:DNA uptake protein ComE-like DNA-binding protein
MRGVRNKGKAWPVVDGRPVGASGYSCVGTRGFRPWLLTEAPLGPATKVSLRPGSWQRRGSILITTMWVVVALTGLVLVLAQSMRIEAVASANRLSEAQAATAERGVEQFLLSVVDEEVATPGSTSGISMEARQIGDAYFWVMKPSYDDEQTRVYGLTDEAGKVDLNTASYQMLQKLPNIPTSVAASIYNWRGTALSGDGQGATDGDYAGLPDPYKLKQSIFETTDELNLVLGVTPDLLFGSDTNRNGVLDGGEQTAGGVSASISGTSSSNLGIIPFVSAWGRKTAASSSSNGLVDVNSESTNKLQTTLQNAGISSDRAKAIVLATHNIVDPPRPATGKSFRNIWDWAVQVNLLSTEFSKVINKVTTNPASTNARMNVNTASRVALACLPGLQTSDADAIIAHRQSNASSNLSNIAWLLDVVPKSKLASIGSRVMGTSACFSGDIVAVSGDGRAFKRFMIVIDGRKSPSKIIYRRELTNYGWPLDASVRTALRSGHPEQIQVQSNAQGVSPSLN